MAQGLGRGLGSLIPKKTLTYGQNPFKSDELTEEKLVMSDGDRILKIKLEDIDVNPHQPRTDFNEAALHDLAESIKEHGVISPLIVTKKDKGFELIAGERRLRASKLAGLKEVPVIVREEGEQKKLELALIENLQRQNLNPLESAIAYRRLIDEFNLTQEEAANKLGKARSSVANALRLLSLPPEIQRALADGRVSEAHAKYLLGLESEAKQINVFKKIVRHNLSVLETSKEISRLGGTKAARHKDIFDEKKENELSSYLNTRVNIKRARRGGQIIISFFGDEELGEILTKISK